MDEDYYDEEEDDGGRESLVLHTGNDGKPTISKQSAFVQVLESEMKLISGFLKENKKAFNKYLKVHNSDGGGNE